VQAPGRVDEEDVGAVAARQLERVEGEARGVGAGLARDDRRAGALAPYLQLLDRGGAERVAGGVHDALAGVAVLLRELGDRRRLPRAVDADDQDDVRLPRGIEA